MSVMSSGTPADELAEVTIPDEADVVRTWDYHDLGVRLVFLTAQGEVVEEVELP